MKGGLFPNKNVSVSARYRVCRLSLIETLPLAKATYP